MEDFTVLLLRPDYVADTFGQDTYLAHVKAPTVALAQKAAQKEAADADTIDEGAPCAPENYYVLLVLRGVRNDVKVDE